MNQGLVFNIEKRFVSGVRIAAGWQQPSDGYSITVLYGPSGCGKTTLLRCLAGLERPQGGRIVDQGDVWFDALEGQHWSPQRRRVGFLFQEYALFPHLTVAQNVAYGARHSNARPTQAVEQLLQRFQLDGLRDRYPHQLSGGQQQRTALARVLAIGPRLLLLDEPLSALDAMLREGMRVELRQVLEELAIPVILVTHDPREAIALGDRIAVMIEGEIRQIGETEQVFDHPQDLDVARVVGMETIVAGQIIANTDGKAIVQIGACQIHTQSTCPPSSKVHVGIKADHVGLVPFSHHVLEHQNHFAGTVQWICREGSSVRIGLDCGFPLTAMASRSTVDRLEVQVGMQLVSILDGTKLAII